MKIGTPVIVTDSDDLGEYEWNGYYAGKDKYGVFVAETPRLDEPITVQPSKVREA